MKQLIGRQKKIVTILAWSSEYITIDELSVKINRSIRTVYDDLKAINQWIELNELPVTLEKKRSLGIRLTGSVGSFRNLENYEEFKEKEERSPENRQYEIAQVLLVEGKTITYQGLMDKYYVSSTSIKNDLEKIQKNYQIKLSSTKQGTTLSENEEGVRKGLFLLSEQLLEKNDLESIDAFETKGPELFGQIFGEELTYYVFQKIAEIQYSEEFTLPFQYLKSATLNVLIYLYRLSKGYSLERESDFLFEQIQSIESYYFSSEVLQEASDLVSSLRYGKTEIEALNTLLISQGLKVKDAATQTNKQLNEAIDQLIKNMSEIFEVDFTKDQTLRTRLTVHFIPMVYRLQAGITINNPLLEEIKRQYALTFNSVCYALADIENQLQLTFNEDEVSFLAVYFQVVLEKMDFGKRILIVCPTGIGTSELILNKVRKMLPQKDSLEITTLRQLKKNDLSKVDFVISSVELGQIEKPVVQVSPLISAEDMRNISRLYSEVFLEEPEFTTEVFDASAAYLSGILKQDYLFLDKCFQNKSDCLTFLIDHLEKQGDVTKDFRVDVFEREKMGATSLESGVAIPHASPKNVRKSRICVLALDKGIVWDKYKVNMIILICIAEKDRKQIRGILSEIYQIVVTKEKVSGFLDKIRTYSMEGRNGNDASNQYRIS
ncbi:transcription antiterminator [Enterococcus sp. BWM-S5]|uniref:Transcription antiterminator n=1 Tax=Enterococcus larvae TaxID=2794352 RepID=A0ABS4CMD5_9ENTE|nr:PTS sugar transporter subunit IIA [Enterococcus larvae]MBP1047751.1 transcription antiterminator [Enterococcus larvae]